MYHRSNDTPPRSRPRRWTYVVTSAILGTIVWGTVGLSFGCDSDNSTDPDIVEETYISSSETTTSYNEAIRDGTNKLLNLGDYQGAIKDFDEAIRLEPQNAVAYFNRGTAYLHQGIEDLASKKFEHAIEAFIEVVADYDEAIRLDPEYADAYGSRGVAFVYLEKYERAIEDYTEAIRIEPQTAELYAARAVLHHELGAPQQSMQDWETACELDKQYCN